MRRRVPILLSVLLLVCAPVLGVSPVAGQTHVDGTHFEAQLLDDGDAQWEISVRIPIENEDEREEFEAFADRFEDGQHDFELGTHAFERAVEEASTASGREMTLSAFDRDSEVVNVTDGGETTAQYGVLTVSFTWESFARSGDNGTLYVDDAFNTTDGTWLPGLGPEQTLTIRAPAGYGGPTTSPIGADAGDLHWEGPTTFEPGYFTIVYHPTTTGSPTETMSTPLVIGALVLSTVALLLGIYLLLGRWRYGPDGIDPSGQADESDPNEAPENGEPTPGGDDRFETEATDSDGGPDGDSDGGDEPDLELLSDEERVEYLLERNGGRMKQAMIVKETGWSNAKVSQLLSSMAEDDRVDKLRIGRENLISLPGEGVGALGDDQDEADVQDS